MTITQSPTLDRVIEALNDEYPDDMIQNAYELLVNGDDPEEIEDPLAVFLVQDVARVIQQGAGVRTAMRLVSDHLLTLASDIRGMAKAIKE